MKIFTARESNESETGRKFSLAEVYGGTIERHSLGFVYCYRPSQCERHAFNISSPNLCDRNHSWLERS
jgi:hypothetical protein